LESNWRWNVAELGWSNAGFPMIARVVDPFNPTYYVTYRELGLVKGLYLGFPDLSGWIESWSLYELHPNYRHFPFGWPVYPD